MKRPRVTIPGFFEWDEMDEQVAREAKALAGSFCSIVRSRGTPKRQAKLAGGPKNRAARKW